MTDRTTTIEHHIVVADGARLHVARLGAGRPIVLLHGWPEFWLTWEPVMRRLAGRFTLIAPDLRGFGDSVAEDQTAHDRTNADAHAADILTVLDELDIARVGAVGHDVGGAVMQALARRAPERVVGLFGFNFVHPGIGRRMGAPDRLGEIWYQSFNQMPLAETLIGASREACAAYIGHFLRHWAGRPDAFNDVMDVWIDNFRRPGNLVGGFNWYRAAHAGRIAMMEGRAPMLPPITVPACIRWTDRDPLFPPTFADGLETVFAMLDRGTFPGAGHFPHREAPDRAAAEIGAFFDRIWPPAMWPPAP